MDANALPGREPRCGIALARIRRVDYTVANSAPLCQYPPVASSDELLISFTGTNDQAERDDRIDNCLRLTPPNETTRICDFPPDRNRISTHADLTSRPQEQISTTRGSLPLPIDFGPRISSCHVSSTTHCPPREEAQTSFK
ncbi:hypothetical protein R1flu_023935 [Riccia fluitans]|uniref:Uncharacterized protein n=1 Tax=Riccia fluitans TaxID=41844 RepID=A0ABD1XUA5_9MARC